MKKAILIVCVLALLVAASAAFAGDGSRVFLAFKAGWSSGVAGTNTGANTTASFGAAPTTQTSNATLVASSYNIAATNGVNSAWITYKKPANTLGYTFTLVVAPGTGATLEDHIGDAHQNSCFISAWNMESWSGTTGMSLPDNWQVTVSGEGVVGGSVSWSRSDLLVGTAPATTIVGPVGFWYNYSGHYADWGSAITAGELITVTVGPAVPEPGSMLALGSGLMGLVGFAIRRRRA